ncbi:VWA domain-containing protein [Candidatus Methylospira mobilis]|uniref:VWA domain-containing protein n=1 Tax=Candidatus Methylospira mobilis TaxID=1808979 RepID=A0A5Q0BFJ9_9GAMM|nr:vWA domain-containing protein [Candidatus Methylospira mobilis]QFY42600.1 VWA domain-containing protein [Candidatus Methylospira mobilis]WNV04285.1 vWA domain-containing protein [Candidatus Methylospira mobilis]
MKDKEFHYCIPWRTANAQPGAHPGRQSGSGFLFLRHVAFIDHPDPRRLDLRATLLDPQQDYRVRVYQQRSNINIFVIVDLSASMNHRAETSKMQMVADFIDSLALAVHRAGDTLGIIGYGDKSEPVLFVSSTRQAGILHAAAAKLRKYQPSGAHALGLLQAASLLPSHRCLVFLLSDCHYSIVIIKQVMTSLSRHDVIPVVIWGNEERMPQATGIANMRDMENGRERLLWLRPALRSRLRASLDDRRRLLTRAVSPFGRVPLFLDGEFSADAVTRYFYAGR